MTAIGGHGALLAALQLSDSALPIGRFAHSLGLEAWLGANPAADARRIGRMVVSAVVEGAAPLDGAAVAHAHRADSLAGLMQVDRCLTSRKLVPGARAASCSCGRQLAKLGVRLVPDDRMLVELEHAIAGGETDGNLAIVHATLARAAGLGAVDAVLIELRGAAAALLSVAVRLGRLSSLDAQVMQAELWSALEHGAQRALGIALEDLRSNAFELDLHALAHRQVDVRFFKT